MEKARKIQAERFQEEKIFSNAEMKNAHLKKYCYLSPEVDKLLIQAASSFQLSARAYLKMIKTARTIADLEDSSEIKPAHIAEALQYRSRFHDER